MTSSGTYTWSLNNSDIGIEAFERCGIASTSLTRRHMRSMSRSLNLALKSWVNRGVNLWAVKPFTIQIVTGQAVYTAGAGVTNIPPQCLSVLDVYFSIIDGGGTGINTDRLMLPVSRSEWDAYPDKLQPGTPTVYWFNKQISPELTIYQAPQLGYPTNQISGHYLSQVQDASISGGQTPDAPDNALDALCDDLAVRLATKFAPERKKELKDDFRESWGLFSDTNREDTSLVIMPDFGGRYGD